MKCPKCNFDQPDRSTECAKCGIIFEKYLSRQKLLSNRIELQKSSNPQDVENKNKLTTIISLINELFFYDTTQVNPFYFGGRVAVFLVIFIWGWKFILSPIDPVYINRSFMHLINLPFHEAGHIIFRPFGQFLMMLGGSLMQLIVPLICCITLLAKTRDPFGASVSLWWLGESFMDLAPYINDARELKMILLGGVTGREVADYHDWEFILRKLGCLECDHILATIAYTIGVLIMLCSFIWGGYLLVNQRKNLLSRQP